MLYRNKCVEAKKSITQQKYFSKANENNKGTASPKFILSNSKIFL
jgi:hypothetical protein